MFGSFSISLRNFFFTIRACLTSFRPAFYLFLNIYIYIFNPLFCRQTHKSHQVTFEMPVVPLISFRAAHTSWEQTLCCERRAVWVRTLETPRVLNILQRIYTWLRLPWPSGAAQAGLLYPSGATRHWVLNKEECKMGALFLTFFFFSFQKTQGALTASQQNRRSI